MVEYRRYDILFKTVNNKNSPRPLKGDRLSCIISSLPAEILLILVIDANFTPVNSHPDDQKMVRNAKYIPSPFWL